MLKEAGKWASRPRRLAFLPSKSKSSGQVRGGYEWVGRVTARIHRTFMAYWIRMRHFVGHFPRNGGGGIRGTSELEQESDENRREKARVSQGNMDDWMVLGWVVGPSVRPSVPFPKIFSRKLWSNSDLFVLAGGRVSPKYSMISNKSMKTKETQA